MYPGKYVVSHAEQPAFIMAETGEGVTYAELERRSNRLAQLLRARGLRRLDHYAIFMENNARYVECCTAGIRSGLYFTCVNSYLTAEELAYIVDNSQSKILISSMARRAVALAALEKCPRVDLCLLVDGPGDGNRVLGLDRRPRAFPIRLSLTRRWALPCSTPPARQVGRRVCCGLWLSFLHGASSRCSSFLPSSGDIGRGWSICHLLRSIMQRRRLLSVSPFASAERP